MLNEGRSRPLSEHLAKGKNAAALPTHQRERGLWSFLTWSFFLSQLAVGNAFTGGAAQAAHSAELDTSSGGTSSSNGLNGVGSTPDFRTGSAEELSAEAVAAAAALAQAHAALNAIKNGGVETLDITSDAGLAAHAAMARAGGGSDEETAANGNDDVVAGVPPEGTPGNPGENPPGSGPGIDPPGTEPVPGINLPPIVDVVLPPVLDTVGDVTSGLGNVLDGILPPVVETVEDLANVLGPTLDQTLSPVGTIVGGLVEGLEPITDPLLAPVSTLTAGVGDILEPVGELGGGIMALADPVLDLVDPLLSPVTNLLDAAQPITDPILKVADPVVDTLATVTAPLTKSLAPVTEPLLELLPLNLGGSGGILSTLLGTGGNAPVASSGDLQFASQSEPANHELFEAGGYTDYGLAVHESTNPVSGLTNVVGNVADALSMGLDSSDDDASGLPSVLGSLSHELGLRGLGEGLV